MLKRFFIVFVFVLFNSLHTVAYHLNKEEFAHNIKYFLVFIFTINGSVLSSLAIDPIDYVKLNVFIDQWYMERGIESEDSRMSLPPFNPPKDLEWRQQKSNKAWILKLSAEAEALEQAREELEKQILIQENEKRHNEEVKKKNDEKERMELERLTVEAALEAQKEIDEQNIRVAIDVTLEEEEAREEEEQQSKIEQNQEKHMEESNELVQQQSKIEQNQEKHMEESNKLVQHQDKKELKITQAVEPLNNIKKTSESIKQQEGLREDQEAKSNEEENKNENGQTSRNQDGKIRKKRLKERAKIDAKKKITNEQKSKYEIEDQKQHTDARRRKRNTNASKIGAKYLHRMAEITNLMRGSTASMEEGDKGSTMKPMQLETRSLREEYSKLKKKYRREFAKQASQDTLIQDLGQDIDYYSTEPVENIEVDRIQRERLDNTTPSTRMQRNTDHYHSRENAFEMLTKMVNDGTNKLSNEERSVLLEEIDTFKSNMAELKSKARGQGDISSSKNIDLRKEIQQEILELRSQMQSFEENLAVLLDSRVV
jgi:hypothetical protein